MNAALWMLADSLDVVPMPADPVVAERLADWWTYRRSFACPHVQRDGYWWVVYPEPGIVCGDCVLDRFAAERRCLYCDEPVDMETDHNVVHESRGFVITMARAHRSCAEEAAR